MDALGGSLAGADEGTVADLPIGGAIWLLGKDAFRWKYSPFALSFEATGSTITERLLGWPRSLDLSLRTGNGDDSCSWPYMWRLSTLFRSSADASLPAAFARKAKGPSIVEKCFEGSVSVVTLLSGVPEGWAVIAGVLPFEVSDMVGEPWIPETASLLPCNCAIRSLCKFRFFDSTNTQSRLSRSHLAHLLLGFLRSPRSHLTFLTRQFKQAT